MRRIAVILMIAIPAIVGPGVPGAGATSPAASAGSRVVAARAAGATSPSATPPRSEPAARGDDAEVTDRLRKLRAAALLHVVRFARWPEDRFADEHAPVVIGVPRGAAITPYLVATFRERGVGGRRIVVRELDLAPAAPAGGHGRGPASDSARIEMAIAACHVVYVPEDRRPADALARAWPVARRGHVLLVVEEQARLDRGGMLAMPLEDGRIALVVNRRTQEQAGIELSSRLLKLATIVEREGRP